MKKTGRFVLMLFAFTGPVLGQVNLESGLVAWYPFNGNANDETGNGYYGRVEGADLTTDRFDEPNSAFDFDGDEYIQFINVPRSPSVTWAAWFCSEADLSGRVIITSAGAGAISVEQGDQANVLRTYIETGKGDWNVSHSPRTVNDGAWHFAVLTYDQNEVRAYLDGEEYYQDFDTGNIDYDALGFWAGKHWSGDYGYFSGKIDDIRIYDRALTPEEVTALYEEGTEPGGNDPGGNDPGGNDPGGNDPGGNDPGGHEPRDAVVRGDMNGDGLTDLFDLLLARDLAAGFPRDADSTLIFAGDLDLDHAVTAADVKRFRDIVLGKSMPPPTVFSIQPSAASPGDEIVIAGSGFHPNPDSNFVRIHGIAADIIFADTARLTITVPDVASSGDLAVYTAGQPSNAVACVIDRPADAPVITAVEPVSAMRGQEVVITGSRFGAVRGNSQVFIGDIAADDGDILSWTDGEIRMRVPADAFPGNLYILSGSLCSNAADFHVTVAWCAELEEEDIAYTADSVAYVKNMIILEFQKDTALPAIDTFLEAHRLTLSGLIYDTREVQARIEDGRDPFQLAQELAGETDLENAFPSVMFELQTVASESWPEIFSGKYNSTDATLEYALTKQYRYHFAMRTLEGHRLAEKILGPDFDTDVRVAILDTGFGDGSGNVPPDFTSRIVLPTNVTLDGFHSPPSDVHPDKDHLVETFLKLMEDQKSHGTAVAGCAGGGGHLCLGTGKHVNLRPIQICIPIYDLVDPFSVAGAIAVAASDPSVFVINLSLLSGGTDEGPLGWFLKYRLRNVLALAENNDKLIVMCAGNESKSTSQFLPQLCVPDLPRNFDSPPFMVVAGTGFQDMGIGSVDTYYPRSNFGNNISVAAPADFSQYPPFLLNSDYTAFQSHGTSLAAPFVSGLAAEMFLINRVMLKKNLDFRRLLYARDIIYMIQHTADFMGEPTKERFWNSKTGYGRINVWKAILSCVNGYSTDVTIGLGPLWIGFDLRASMNVPDASFQKRIFDSYKDAIVYIDDQPLTDSNNPNKPYENLTLFKCVPIEKTNELSPRLYFPQPNGLVSKYADLLCSFSISREEVHGPNGRFSAMLRVRKPMDDLSLPPYFEMPLNFDNVCPDWPYDDYVYTIHLPIMDIVCKNDGRPVTMIENDIQYTIGVPEEAILEMTTSVSFKNKPVSIDFYSENGTVPVEPLETNDRKITVRIPPEAITNRVTVNKFDDSMQDTRNYSFSSMQELVIPRVVSITAPDTKPGSAVEIAVHVPHFNEKYKSYDIQIQFPEQTPVRPDKITPVTGQLFTHVLYSKIPENLKPDPVKVILTVDNGEKVTFGDKGIVAVQSDYNYCGIRLDFKSSYKVVTKGVTTTEKTGSYLFALGCPVQLVDGEYKGETEVTDGEEGWKETTKTTISLHIDPATNHITTLTATFHKTYQSTPGLYRSVTLKGAGSTTGPGSYDTYDQYDLRGGAVTAFVTEFVEKWGTDSDYNEYRDIVADDLNKIVISMQKDN
ncbi:IPT/TIG domain-containing protein [bacterium]|nr:IPT/TIG domain-containing protein [bacterium]